MALPFNIHDEEDNDDKPVGRVMSRREVLALLGGAGAAILGGCTFTDLFTGVASTSDTAVATSETASALSCVVKPDLTEGPYFVDEMLNRMDIRIEPSDGSIKPGQLLTLTMRIFDVSGGTCAPVKGAQVDIWHCDATGQYSDVADQGFDTQGQKWLRGYQVTDDMGTVKFITIYPGWYSGRAVHIHFKVRTDPTSDTGFEFTSQLFFDEATTSLVYAQQPYAAKGQTPDTSNATDGIFQGSGGTLTLTPTLESDGSYSALMEIGMDLSDAQSGADDSASGGGGGMGGPGGGQPPSGTPPQRP